MVNPRPQSTLHRTGHPLLHKIVFVTWANDDPPSNGLYFKVLYIGEVWKMVPVDEGDYKTEVGPSFWCPCTELKRVEEV